MASLTIRNLEDEVKHRLRRQAAENGRSLEAEVRQILNRSVNLQEPPRSKTGLDLFRGIRAVVEKYGGVELEIPPRTAMRGVSFEEEGEPLLMKKERRHSRPRKK